MTALLSASLSTRAMAALEVTSEHVTGDGSVTLHTMSVSPEGVTIDSDKSIDIMRAGSGKVIHISKDDHEYMEIDQAAMSSRMAAARAMMQQRLQSMPEAQRQRIEAMMAKQGGMGMGSDTTPVPASYVKTGQTKTVSGWSCQVFHKMRSGMPEADLCIASMPSLGMTGEDLAAMRGFAQSMGKMALGGGRQNAGMEDFDAQTRAIGYEGMAVETVFYMNGQGRSTSTVKSIAHAPLPPGAFDIPPGYTKKEMPGFGPPDGGQ